MNEVAVFVYNTLRVSNVAKREKTADLTVKTEFLSSENLQCGLLTANVT